MTEALFAAREERGVIARLDDDDAIGVEARLRKCGRKQIRARDAPEHLTIRPCGNSRGEKDGGGSVDSAGCAACDFMERGEGEAAAGEGLIDWPYAKWDHARIGASYANTAHIVPKLAQKRFVPHGRPSKEFLFCSRHP